MAAIPRLQTLSRADLDDLIAELKQQGSTGLNLVGPLVEVVIGSSKQWSDNWDQNSVVYQLEELVPDLAQRLVALSQLTSLDISYNEIGDAGAVSLAALTQLSYLNLLGNEIGDAGAISLAGLTQLTHLNLEGNEIGDAGAISLAGLTQLTSLNLHGNGISDLNPLLALKNLNSLDLRHTKVQDLTPLKPLLEAGLEASWVKFGGSGINV